MTLSATEVDRLVDCRLADLLTEAVVTDGVRHRWVEVRSQTAEWEATAFRVAVHIARLRCGGSPHLFGFWLARVKGGIKHSPELRDVLEAQLASESIGTPAHPAPEPHIEGFVAEHIWHALTTEIGSALGLPIRVEEPSWSATDSGGDGLAVFRVGAMFAFRLWESKSHTAELPVRYTVRGAGGQLTSKGMRYLARFSKVGQELADPDLAQFYGRLTEMWRNTDPASGVGVSICTVTTADLGNPFDHLSDIGEFADRNQREGLLVVIEDFPRFAASVREQLWNGL